MTAPKTYTSREVVESYDYRHFGRVSGQHIFQRDCQALESLFEPPVTLILDVPCGTGIYAHKLYQLGYQVIAADASLTMLETASQRAPDILKVLCDIHHLPFRTHAFDTVITVRLFQHYPAAEIVQMLRELGRIIRPQGRVIFDTFRWTPRRLPLLRRIFRGEMHVFSHREVDRIIKAAGLVNIQETSLYLFSPIWQRKLPLWVVRGLDLLERIIPQRWLLRTFWACTDGTPRDDRP